MDNRTPEELGQTMAEQMHSRNREYGSPPEFLISDSFEKFCTGRNLSECDRDVFETNYKTRWRELNVKG